MMLRRDKGKVTLCRGPKDDHVEKMKILRCARVQMNLDSKSVRCTQTR